MNEIIDARQEDIDHKLLLDIIPQPLFLVGPPDTITYANTISRQLGIVPDKSIWQPLKDFDRYDSVEVFNIQVSNGAALSLLGHFQTYNIQIFSFTMKGIAAFCIFSRSKNKTQSLIMTPVMFRTPLSTICA